MKHEGYTPGPWIRAGLNIASGNVVVASAYKDSESSVVIRPTDDTECLNNARLIADAPRLAEENERLREACKSALDIINAYSHIPAQFKACEILQAALGQKGEGK